MTVCSEKKFGTVKPQTTSAVSRTGSSPKRRLSQGAKADTTPKQSTPHTLRTSAFTLVSYANGKAKLTLTNSEVFDPPVLRRALAHDGIPALVTLQGSQGAKVFNIDPYYFETQFSGTGSTEPASPAGESGTSATLMAITALT